MNFSYTSVKAIRQEIIRQSINTHLLNRKHKMHDDDPFEIYHYEDTRSDDKILTAIEKDVKEKINEVANIEEMRKIKEGLEITKHMIQQQIDAEMAEMQSLDILIRRLERQKENEEELLVEPKRKTIRVQAFQQTEKPKMKDIGTFTTIENQEKQKQKQNYLVKGVVSIKIASPAQKQFKKQSNSCQRQKLCQTISFQQNRMIGRTNQESQVKKLYKQLQTEMSYLQHLKKQNKNKERSQYRQQKRRIKFMMELFWKTARSNPLTDQDSVELKQLEEFQE